MTNKQRGVMSIARTKKDFGISKQASKMTDQECEKYLDKVWKSLSEKQKQLADRDNPLGWPAIIEMSDQECDREIRMREEDKSAGVNFLLNS